MGIIFLLKNTIVKTQQEKVYTILFFLRKKFPSTPLPCPLKLPQQHPSALNSKSSRRSVILDTPSTEPSTLLNKRSLHLKSIPSRRVKCPKTIKTSKDSSTLTTLIS